MIIFSRPVFSLVLKKYSLNTYDIKNLKNVRFVCKKSKYFQITSSRWQWIKCKDLFHFYTSLGILCVGSILLLSNTFIGPAKLESIPDGYRPNYWEYYQHPISRFIAKYFGMNPQQEYEKYMHYIYEEDETKRIRQLENKIRKRMAERNDYKAWYYTPALAKYVKISKDTADYLASIRGD